MNLKTLTLPLALAGAVFAQEGQNASVLGQRTQDPYGVPTLAETQGGLRASGRAFEATFDGGSMQYLPVLGKAAPTNQPFSFSFVSAQRGSTVIEDRVARDAKAYGLTATVHRPGAIDEQYEVRSEGLKQSFVFGQDFGSKGDLIVRGRIDTPLPFNGKTDQGGLSFVHPEWGGVELGEVVGFDAAGRKVVGSMNFDGEILEMSLPASFVDQAAWPVTLDPVIGSAFAANADSFNAVNPDAATSANGSVLVVFTRQFSLTSSGVRAQRLTALGATNGGVLFLTNEPFALNGAVGYNNQQDNWLVAYESRASVFEQSDIVVRTVAADGTTSTPLAVAAGATNDISPDVASDGRGSDNECVVVWVEEGAGLRASQVSANTTPFAFSTVNVTSNANDANPAISQNCGTSTFCMVAFERGTTVRATRVTINAQVLGSSVLVANNASAPDCDGDGDFAMVVYQRPEAGNIVDHDIFGRCYDLSPLAPLDTEIGIDTNVNSDEIEPAIAFLGPNALVMYSDQSGTSPFNYDLFGYTYDLTGCTRCSGLVRTDRTFGGRQHKPVVTSRLSGDISGGSQRGLFLWSEQSPTNGFFGDVYARRFNATGSGGSRSTIAPGCGLGGSLSAPSAPTLGEDLVLNVTGADPGSAAGFLLLREPGTALFNCGICSAVIPAVSLPASNLSGGNFSFTIPVPCDLSLNGGRFDWQGAVLGTSQTPCLFGPGVGFSNVYRTVLGN